MTPLDLSINVPLHLDDHHAALVNTVLREIAVGLDKIGSVRLLAKQGYRELGYFLYGGSLNILPFSRGLAAAGAQTRRSGSSIPARHSLDAGALRLKEAFSERGDHTEPIVTFVSPPRPMVVVPRHPRSTHPQKTSYR